jgi:hypothetical protein
MSVMNIFYIVRNLGNKCFDMTYQNSMYLYTFMKANLAGMQL